MMGPLLAIIGDTWRQSKHQWVLMVLIAMIAMIVAAILYVPEVRTAPDGSQFLASRFQKETDQGGMERGWDGLYADALRQQLGYDDEIKQRGAALNKVLDRHAEVDFHLKRYEATDPNNAEVPALMNEVRALEQEIDRRQRERFELEKFVRSEVDRLTDERTAGVDKMQKGVEFWLASAAFWIFIVSMIGFIAACAVYIPNMIEAGSIDLVLSKPLRRWQLYFGKYMGGLALFSSVLVIAYVITFVGIGIKSGVWHWSYFGALPMTIFALALLFSIIAWVGLWTRSTAMAMVIGYVYYLVVDTAVGNLKDMPFLGEFPFIEQFSKVLNYTFPSFKWLRESAEAAVLTVNVVPWHHVIVGMVWLVICLGTSYNRFRINDY